MTNDLVVDELQAKQRALRLAVVTETYPPEINGVAMTIARFVDGLRMRRHDVQLIRPRQTKSDAGELEEVLMRGLPIPRYPHLKMGLPAKNALVKLWSMRRPDVVHIVTEGPLGWSALQAAIKLKLPVTSDFRTNFHAYSGHYGIGWLQKPIFAYLRKFHNRTQCTMVPTESLRRELQAMGFHNLRVVARGVDTELFHPAKRDTQLRSSWGAGESTPVAIYVGRLASEKNLRALIAAYEAMRAVRPDMKLVLVGDGPARRDLEAQIPGAVFVGLQRGEALARHYASGDIFLFPSITETFGNVTPEAMASGLTVLAYDYAAAAQLIRPGESGCLVPYDNTEAFVAAAANLARDWPQARNLGANGRFVAEQLGWNRLVEDLEAVFHQTAQTVPTSQGILMPQPQNASA
ncbi:MAG: glycosyltransferase family 1 protein [Rhodocyclaceae bacterium]|nr:glycosyltransferase family 1 protein [Rhodocyclaceae bacterium]